MQLTKGQKDALVHKVMDIISEKKESQRKKLRDSYKPSKETQKLLEKIKKIVEARDSYQKLVESLGFDFCYSSARIKIDGSWFDIDIMEINRLSISLMLSGIKN